MKSSYKRMLIIHDMGLDGKLEKVCVLELGGKQELAYEWSQHDKLAYELELDDMEQACVPELVRHNLHKTHQQYIQRNDQLYILHFGVYRREEEHCNHH